MKYLTIPLLFFALCLPASAAPQPSPVGAMVFCLAYPDECKGGGASKIALTQEAFDLIDHVNRQVNRRIKSRVERGDTWSINVRYGDCEDYALTKRGELIAAGIDASALRIAQVVTKDGVDHAVLVVVTDHGDLVLDNLNKRVSLRDKSTYTFVAMSQRDLLHWTFL